MAGYNRNNGGPSAEDKALERFADLMIKKIETISGDWKKPWFTERTAWPRNIYDGKHYDGLNGLMLSLHCEEQGYKIPVFGTFDRFLSFNYSTDGDGNRQQLLDDAGEPLPKVSVNKGEKSFPLYFTSFTVIDKETKEKIKWDDYKKLSAEEQKRYNVFPKTTVWPVFAVEQTNLREARPEMWQKLVEQNTPHQARHEGDMTSHPAIDRMIDGNHFYCPIRQVKGDDAYYSISKDEIVIPLREQFVDGEAFASNALHEMSHATGSEGRLARLKPAPFGSPEYAREELVAELSAAVVSNQYGLDKHIKEDSAAYLKSWLGSLKESPDFIRTTLTDVKKATSMVSRRISAVQQVLDAEQGRDAAYKVFDDYSQEMSGKYGPEYYDRPEDLAKLLSPEEGAEFEKRRAAYIDAEKRLSAANDALTADTAVVKEAEKPVETEQKSAVPARLSPEAMNEIGNWEKEMKDNPRFLDALEMDINNSLGMIAKAEKGEKIELEPVKEAEETQNETVNARVIMLQDAEEKRWILYIKPESEKAITIYPEKDDVGRFFAAAKQGEEKADRVRQELAQKYYGLAMAKPDLNIDIFGKAPEGVDLSAIQRVNIFKSKNDGKILCSVSIDGMDRIPPREVSPFQWQKMWLAEDKNEYKKVLAATLFEEQLRSRNEAVQQEHAKELEEEKRRNSPEQKAKEEREEKAKEELTKAETQAVAAIDAIPSAKVLVLADDVTKEKVWQHSASDSRHMSSSAVQISADWSDRYIFIGKFSEGLAAVERGDRRGFIDETGREVIPCQYDDVAAFSAGIAMVLKDGKIGFIDTAGKEVVPCQYTTAEYARQALEKLQHEPEAVKKETVPVSYTDNVVVRHRTEQNDIIGITDERTLNHVLEHDRLYKPYSDIYVDITPIASSIRNGVTSSGSYTAPSKESPDRVQIQPDSFMSGRYTLSVFENDSLVERQSNLTLLQAAEYSTNFAVTHNLLSAIDMPAEPETKSYVILADDNDVIMTPLAEAVRHYTENGKDCLISMFPEKPTHDIHISGNAGVYSLDFKLNNGDVRSYRDLSLGQLMTVTHDVVKNQRDMDMVNDRSRELNTRMMTVSETHPDQSASELSLFFRNLFALHNEAKKTNPQNMVIYRIGQSSIAFEADADRLSEKYGLTVIEDSGQTNAAGVAIRLTVFGSDSLDDYVSGLEKDGLAVDVNELHAGTDRDMSPSASEEEEIHHGHHR